ncbi:MAG: hypothetical protein JNL10_09085 [Verrucomicrobiales bacterium]|nr:hypothetical protein [Verrucomicrobiales bacterium]
MNPLRILCGVLLLALGLSAASGQDRPLLQPHDVVAVLGGTRMVALEKGGYAEALVAAARPADQLRWRGLAWEGDTVFSRPRELNYPPLTHQLRTAGATVVLLQFGEMESLAGPREIPRFLEAYANLLDEVNPVTSRQILVSPTPTPGFPSSPDRLAALSDYAAAIRTLAARRNIPFLDLQLAASPDAGDASVGRALAAGLVGPPARSHSETDARGRFVIPDLEAVRQAVVARNRLWFDYTRPMNWAFLAGDRTEQPSSRDHRDRNIRWFPAEMERFVPLISQADEQIWKAADTAHKEVR